MKAGLKTADGRRPPSARFSFRGLDAEQRMALELLPKGKLNAEKLITHRSELDRINGAFAIAEDKQKTGAVFAATAI